MLLKSCQSVFSAAAQLCTLLVTHLSAGTVAERPALAGMKQLRELVECLPLDQASYCYFRNRLTSILVLLKADAVPTAHYQLREMSRKLARLAKDFS